MNLSNFLIGSLGLALILAVTTPASSTGNVRDEAREVVVAQQKKVSPPKHKATKRVLRRTIRRQQAALRRQQRCVESLNEDLKVAIRKLKKKRSTTPAPTR